MIPKPKFPQPFFGRTRSHIARVRGANVQNFARPHLASKFLLIISKPKYPQSFSAAPDCTSRVCWGAKFRTFAPCKQCFAQKKKPLVRSAHALHLSHVCRGAKFRTSTPCKQNFAKFNLLFGCEGSKYYTSAPWKQIFNDNCKTNPRSDLHAYHTFRRCVKVQNFATSSTWNYHVRTLEADFHTISQNNSCSDPHMYHTFACGKVQNFAHLHLISSFLLIQGVL